MFIDAVTVCIDYAPFLKATLANRELFDTWTIVTVERDIDTILLCEKNDLNYIITDRIYENGDFCKGKAINDAIDKIKPKDWICVVDADTYLFESLGWTLRRVEKKKDCIYGLYGRLLVKDEDELKDMLNRVSYDEDEFDAKNLLVGFFQMWHSSYRQYYPEESTHAGLDDVLMRDSFMESNRKILSAYAIHIGDLWKNHKGMPR